MNSNERLNLVPNVEKYRRRYLCYDRKFAVVRFTEADENIDLKIISAEVDRHITYAHIIKIGGEYSEIFE